MTPVAPADPQTELGRVLQRWRQLPLEHASESLPRVRLLLQRLADTAATASGRSPAPVPELGPGAVMDQLAVLVYDATASGLGAAAAQGLADLRRDLP